MTSTFMGSGRGGLRGETSIAMVRQEPGDRLRHAGAERHGGLEAEQLAGPTHLQAAPRLAVGLRGVPLDSSLEADLRRDELRQLPNGDLFDGPEIHRFGTVV